GIRLQGNRRDHGHPHRHRHVPPAPRTTSVAREAHRLCRRPWGRRREGEPVMSDEHVDCSQALYRMTEYLDGEMTTEDAHEIARHLTECAPCLEEHEREQIIKRLIRRSCAQEAAP